MRLRARSSRSLQCSGPRLVSRSRERLAAREHASGVSSDADLAVYLSARAKFEPPDEVPPNHVVGSVSGEGLPEEAASLVIDRMIELAGRPQSSAV